MTITEKATKHLSSWIVYILECTDSTFYTGITNDLAERVRAHNLGKGGKYTRSRLPVVVKYKERRSTKGAALSREAAIKRLTRPEKVALISSRKPRTKKP